MADPTGEADRGALRRDFNRSPALQFLSSTIISDAGLLPYRELYALRLTNAARDRLADTRCYNPAMRWVGGDRAIPGSAALASRMSRFDEMAELAREPCLPCRSAQLFDQQRANRDRQRPSSSHSRRNGLRQLILSVRPISLSLKYRAIFVGTETPRFPVFPPARARSLVR
jgi:hypothetical protein